MTNMAEKSETVNINVQLAERTYPLKVLKSDEEKVHSAVKLVNEKIKEYQAMYNGKDKQDYMAMCLLNFAVEHEKLQRTQKEDIRLLEEKMMELEKVFTGQL